MLRISFAELQAALAHALESLGMAPARAALSARLIAETDLDGVSTHGIARFARFRAMVRAGRIDVNAEPTRTASFGALERWSGNGGPGNLAAHAAMARAMELAETNGLGGVALAHTNHWQRGGTYGWQAVEAGFAAMCWTNTLPNLPPWGATTPAVGNNPLVIALPRPRHAGATTLAPVVLDMAMSQFSYGTLAAYRDRSEPLPVPGGYDAAGHITTDAAAIEQTQRALPVGYWKGSGLAFALDVLGAMLADGLATHEIAANTGLDPERETGQSQIFLAVAPRALASQDSLRDVVADAVQFLRAASPVDAGKAPRYPGERVPKTRAENLRLGIPVDEKIWATFVRGTTGNLEQ